MIDAKTMEAIVAEYHDELKGIAAYGKLYKAMIEQGAPEGHIRMIKAIMKDEMEHKDCLYKMIISSHAFTPEAIVKATKEAEEAYDLVFNGK